MRTNGVFNVYEIWYNSSKVTTSNKVNNETNRVAFKLEGLKPFSNYTILVRACTQKCSNGSHPIDVETKIGIPSKVMNLKVVENSNLSWEKPEQLNGHLDYYEVKVQFKDNGRVLGESVVKTRQVYCQLSQSCMNQTGVYEFFVKAVNFIPSPHFVGNFSRLQNEIVGYRKCDETDPEISEWLKLDQYGIKMESDWAYTSQACMILTPAWEFLLFCGLLIVGALIILVIVYSFYRKIKDMKNICVTLPPGLEDLTTDSKSKNMDCIKRPDLIPIHMPMDTNVEDECLLKRSLNGSLNGDYYANSSAKSCSSESDSQSTNRSEQGNCDDIDYEQLKHKQLLSDEEDDNELDSEPPRVRLFYKKDFEKVLISILFRWQLHHL